MQRVVLAVKVLDSACGSDAGVSVFPGRACLCSGVCAHAHVGLAFLHFSVVQRSLGGWEVLTSPFGSWAFASVQMSIEDGCRVWSLLALCSKALGSCGCRGGLECPGEAALPPQGPELPQLLPVLTQEAPGARTSALLLGTSSSWQREEL